MRNKIKIGSQLYCVNCKDTDYLIFDESQRVADFDCFMRTEEEYQATKNFQSFNSLFAYQLDSTFNSDNKADNYNVLEHKYEMKTLINETLHKIQNTYYLKDDIKYTPKLFLHILINYYFLLNKAPTLNAEQLVMVQKVHDYQVTYDYLNTFKQLLLELDERDRIDEEEERKKEYEYGI